MSEWDAEIEVDEPLARALIQARYPQLDARELHYVGAGWDNVVWATACGVAFRFPRRAIAAGLVERELALLPALTTRLPVPVPDAAYPGEPSERFPWRWFGSRLLAGRELAAAGLDDAARGALAPQIGAFLRRLHELRLDVVDALPVDPNGRTDMKARVPLARAALDDLAPPWPPAARAAALVVELLDDAERLPAPTRLVLAHGDLHVRHVLVDDHGGLAGVIDWGDACRADPAIDLSLYWSLFTPAGRAAFLTAYGPVGHDALLRARVLALSLCATLANYARAEGMRELEIEAVAGLERTMVGG